MLSFPPSRLNVPLHLYVHVNNQKIYPKKIDKGLKNVQWSYFILDVETTVLVNRKGL